jgi:site-specific DNA recombinase
MVSIRDILRNRVYLGTYSRFGVRVPGSHPALISPDDFRAVQDRLNARRTSYSPRTATQFLLSGLVYCGYCGNKLIGVKRRQSWKRKSGEQGEGFYRYYQCESRTNQSMCDYHTRRAAELEAQVREALSETAASGASFRQAGDEAAVIAEREQECEQLRSRLRQLDRKLEGYVESAAKGRLSADRMRKVGLASAADRLALEETLEEAERRAAQQASAAERRREQEHSLARLLDEWDALPFGGHRALLREVVDRIMVHDDGLRVLLRP